MRHSIKPLPFKPPRLIGLSEGLLASHYENNYGGAVRRLNAIEARLAGTDWPKLPGFEINGLKREARIAANSMVLHEVYFDGLGGADGLGSPAVAPTGPLAEAIARDFGSLAAWREAFTAMGKALGGGSGWVILSWSRREERLVSHWAADHYHILTDSVPLLALDMYEHAYHLDFGADAGAYVEAYLQNLHWGRPAERFARAVGLQPPAGAQPAEEQPLAVEALLSKDDDGQLRAVARDRGLACDASCWLDRETAAIAGLTYSRTPEKI